VRSMRQPAMGMFCRPQHTTARQAAEKAADKSRPASVLPDDAHSVAEMLFMRHCSVHLAQARSASNTPKDLPSKASQFEKLPGCSHIGVSHIP
jgi:hypothetical protein